MRTVLTLMVRDEADIIGPMLEHHRRQGIDTFIITDNGSIDGTREIIEEFASRSDVTVDLRDDPVHQKQQGVRVTQMARDAYSTYGADWIVNADADEFWLPVDRTLTLGQVLAELPVSWGAFPVAVTDLIGPAARSGSGLARLVYRDERPDGALNAAGVFAHPTPDVIHRGSPDVTVVQGNHFVDIASNGAPPPDRAIEVLHLPWRSWEQFRRKVDNTGKAYDNNPTLTPSPNHHGMRDYRRLLRGVLLPSYLARTPDDAELTEGLERGWYRLDDTLATSGLEGEPDVPFDALEAELQRDFGRALHEVEGSRDAAERELARLTAELAASERARADAEAHLRAQLDRRVVRIADALSRLRPRRR